MIRAAAQNPLKMLESLGCVRLSGIFDFCCHVPCAAHSFWKILRFDIYAYLW